MKDLLTNILCYGAMASFVTGAFYIHRSVGFIALAGVLALIALAAIEKKALDPTEPRNSEPPERQIAREKEWANRPGNCGSPIFDGRDFIGRRFTKSEADRLCASIQDRATKPEPKRETRSEP